MDIKISAKDAEAVIASKGAELKSLKLGGRELMWCADPSIWGKSSPVLFPAIGNVKDNVTSIDGKLYKMRKHGFARDNEFNASKTSEKTADFILSSDASTREMLPFDFDFSLHYTLSENKLEILYEVTNKGNGEMPFCIGAHPAFACNDIGKCRLVFEEKETVSSPVMNLKTRMFQQNKRVWRLKNDNVFKLSYPLFDNDVVYFGNIISQSVQLLDENDKGIKLSWEGFTSLGVWTPAGMNAPFICVEPWCGSDDFDTDDGNFRNKAGIQTALKHEPKYYVMTIEAI